MNEYMAFKVLHHAKDRLSRWLGAGKTPRKKVGLALSGGVVWTMAHVGVLQVLEELDIKVDMVGGTSGGSIIGAMWCAGMKAADIEQATVATSWRDLSKFNLIPKRGIVSNKGIGDFLTANVGDITFDKMKTPLRVVATELTCGKKHVFKSGSVADAVRASCAVPGIFEPFEPDGKCYVDGAILEKVPALTLKEEGMDTIISVHFKDLSDTAPLRNIFDIILRSLDLALAGQEAASMNISDITITPDVRGLSRINFQNSRQFIENGRRAALAAMPRLSKLAARQK